MISTLRGSSTTKTKDSDRFKVRAVLGSILLFVVGGIVGNRSDAMFLQSWDTATKSIMGNLWPWAIAGFAVFTSVGMFCFLAEYKTRFNKKLLEKDFLLNLAGTLDFLLLTTLSTRDSSCGLHTFIARAFKTVLQGSLYNARRGCLFLPDAKGEHLVVSDSHGWIDEISKDQQVFCIDPQKTNSVRGIAGEAFLKRKVVVAHVSIDNGHVKCDQASYIPSQDKIAPFCGSLICIPVITGKGTSDCLGVLCFDSYNAVAFDLPETRNALILLAEHISVVLSMREKITREVIVK